MARIIHIADEISEIFLDDRSQMGFHELSNFYIVVSEDEKTLHCATPDKEIAETVKAIMENREGIAAGQELIPTPFGEFPKDFLEKRVRGYEPVSITREEWDNRETEEANYELNDDVDIHGNYG